MLITVDKLSIEFNEDEKEMRHQLEELKKLEKAIGDSTHFKLLAGKTQMISRGKGKVKKERSRIQHTRAIVNLVVKPQIKQIYDRILKENPLYQTSEKHKRVFELNRQIALLRGKCMAMAHDIGHVPFGHEGEKSINHFFSQITSSEDIDAVLNEHLKYFGKKYEEKQGHINEELVDELFPPFVDKQLSFEHNELSGILLNRIIEENGIDLPESERLSLTLGVLGHSTSRTPFELLGNDIVAQIVRVADKVEYINFDYDEISELIIMDSSKFSKEQLDYIRKSSLERIAETNSRLVEEAFSKGKIYEKNPAMKSLSDIRKGYDEIIYLYDGMYADNLLKELLAASDNPQALDEFYKIHSGVEAVYPKDTLEMFKKCRKMYSDSKLPETNITKIDLENAFNRMSTEQLHFKGVLQGENSDRIFLIMDRILRYYYEHQDEIPTELSRTVTPIDFIKPENISYTLTPQYSALQKTLEYVSLMDDEEILQQYHNLVEQRIEAGEGHGIKPITMYEIKQFLRNEYDQAVDKYRRTRATDDDIVYNFLEAKKKYTRRSREFFDSKLTKRGKEALLQYYEQRFSEYNEDDDLCKRMIEKDRERENIENNGELAEKVPSSKFVNNSKAKFKIKSGLKAKKGKLRTVRGMITGNFDKYIDLGQYKRKNPNNSGSADGGKERSDR